MDKERLGVMKFVTLRKWLQPKRRCQNKKRLEPKKDQGFKKFTILKMLATQRKMINFRTLWTKERLKLMKFDGFERMLASQRKMEKSKNI
jgi:hypothetical protein